MDFELSEELKMIQSLAKDFVEGQLKPLEREILGRAADLSDARAYLPAEKEAELVKKVRDMGLWGVGVPEELGGAGLNTLGACLVEEELAATIVPFHFGAVTPILFNCNKEQQERYLRPALNNKKRPYLALMENGNDGLPGMQTKAEKTHGNYIINGKKLSLSRTANDYFAVVFAGTDKGVTCFLIDKETPGFSVNGKMECNGWQSRTREPLSLSFENCRIAVENRLGEEGRAFRLGGKWLPQRRIIRSARSVGMAWRLLDEAAVQAQSASTFGQPLTKRSSVRAALADMAAGIHAARLMVYEAACTADAGKEAGYHAVMVKLQTARMLRSVVDMAVHIYNGPAGGETIDKLCRNALETDIYRLTMEKQRNVIAGQVLNGFRV